MKVNQLKAGVALNYVIIALNIILGLLYTPYMLRMLGQNEFGLYSLASSIIAYLTLLDFGFGSAIVRYVARLIDQDKKREQWEMIGMFLVVYSVIAIVALVGGIILYNNVDVLFAENMTPGEISRARVIMLLLILNLTLTFPLSVFGSVITAYEDFIFQRVLSIVRLILTTVVIIVLLHNGYKSVAMVVVQTVFNLSALFISCVYCFKKLHIKVIFGKYDWGLLREICIYSFWIFLSQIIDRIYWGTGQFVLGATMGTVAVAVFSVAILFQHMYMTFSSAISGVLLPRLTALAYRKESDEEISELFIKTGRIQCYIMTLVLYGFAVFGSSFIDVWAGDGYGESYIVTLIFFAALFVPTIQNTGYVILQARNQMKFRSLLYLGISITSLVFQIILSKKFGIIGCALAIGCALVLGQGIIMNIYYKKVQKLNIGKFWKETLKTMLFPTVLTLITITLLSYFAVKSITTLGICAVAYILVYALGCYLTSFNRYEKDLLRKPFQRIIRKPHQTIEK